MAPTVISGNKIQTKFQIFTQKIGMRVVERAVEKNEKFGSFKLESLKLKRVKRSWNNPIEVGKNRAKLERTERS